MRTIGVECSCVCSSVKAVTRYSSIAASEGTDAVMHQVTKGAGSRECAARTDGVTSRASLGIVHREKATLSQALNVGEGACGQRGNVNHRGCKPKRASGARTTLVPRRPAFRRTAWRACRAAPT